MISIDIGSKKICIIEGNYHGDNVAVSSFGEIIYENEVVVNGTINDRSALSFLINEIIKTNNMKSKSVIVTVNSTDIIVRELKLPNVKLADLKLLVKNEINRITRDDSGFIIDFVVKGVTSDKMLLITACAVPKILVESYYTLIKDLKLSPYALDIPENAMSKLLSGTSINGQTHNESNIIVADIGFSNISFYGFSGGESRFNRTDISPVQEFVRELSSINRIDVSNEYMAALNLTPNFEYENTVISDTCKYFVYKLSEEIQKYIQYLIMNSDLKTVEKIYICGGISSAIGLDIALSDSINLPVDPISNIGKLSVPKGCNITKVCNAAGALIRQ